MLNRIDENTNIPFKVIIPVVSSVVTAAWFLSARLNTIEKNQDRLTEKVVAIEKKIDRIGVAKLDPLKSPDYAATLGIVFPQKNPPASQTITY